MRSPGTVYRRYRQLKKKLLFQKILQARKKIHENCHYSHSLVYTYSNGTTRTIKLCLYNSIIGNDIRALDLCTNPYECTAFACKKTKESVLIEFEAELSNPILKQVMYPELSLMEWILDKNLSDAEKNPSFVGKIILFFINTLEEILKKLG